MAKVIVVFGATGNQGGSVARALLQNNLFKVRGVTRNPNSDKAKALTNQGAEMVKASLDDPSTLPSVLEGSYGVFGVTNYWEHFDKDREIKQGRDLIDACKTAGVKHLVFSLLESVKDAIGKESPHFDTKGEIEKYMFSTDVPSTSVRYSFYMENFLTSLLPQKQSDGTYSLVVPMSGVPMDLIWTGTAGGAVASIFGSSDSYLGKKVGLTGDKKTIAEYADILSKELAPKVFKASEIAVDEYAKLGFPGADDLAAMFDFYQRGNPDRDLALTKTLDPNTKSFEDWVKAHKETLIERLK